MFPFKFVIGHVPLHPLGSHEYIESLRIFRNKPALTEFMLDLGAAMARDDYETRHKRQAQGTAKAKSEGKYRGRRANESLHSGIFWIKA